MSFPSPATSLRTVLRVACVSLALSSASLAKAASLPFVHGKGSIVVDDSGKQVILRGCNLGNWLIVESWMLGWENVGDQTEMTQTLTDRFGAAEANRLVTMYRDGFITPRDFELIKSFDFNVVRVPFDSRMIIDAQGNMKPDAFKYLDRALQLAENAGMYVILDMHGAPGSQSKQDHTGQRDQNKLWPDPQNATKMVALWKRIAERYKDRSVVAAYDLLNEPYGDFQSDYRGPLRELMPRCYESIRSTGDKHLIIFPNALGQAPTFYDDPKSKGMEQVAFTDHYYAGLFGSPSTIRSHAGMFERAMPEMQTYLDRVGGPMLIGEFNVVLSKAGGKPMMRRYYDEFARRGWMATMWSYKSLKHAAGVQDDNWYLVTNQESLPKIDVKTSSLEEIKSALAQFATMPLAVDDELKAHLTAKVAPPIALPELDPLPESAPAARGEGKWKLIDIDTARPAGIEAKGNALSIVAAGTDIFGDHDSFSFLQQAAPKQAVLIATIDRLADSDTWAKAGLMIRFGDLTAKEYASAPFVMLNTFVDGGIGLVTRERPHGKATESKRVVGPLPRRFAIVRDGMRVDAYADDGASSWVKIGTAMVDSVGEAQIGMAVCSHRGGVLTRADFCDATLTKGTALPGDVKQHGIVALQSNAKNLFQNGSLKRAGDTSHIAADWNQWGDALSREDGLVAWSPARGDAGLWQEVNVEVGKPYAFEIRIRRDGAADANATKNPRVTLSLEATLDDKQVALAERTVDLSDLESEDGWSVVRIDATAMTGRMRALVRLSGEGASAGPVAIDGANFFRVPEPR